LIIENSQYTRIDVNYTSANKFAIPGTKLFLLYNGMSSYFTGKEVDKIPFGSLELPFGHFYKTQLSPFFEDSLTSLWPWGTNQTDLYYQFTEPYYEE
jgi:hypothetical protein